MSFKLISPEKLYTPARLARLGQQEKALTLRTQGYDWEEVRKALHLPTIRMVQLMVQRALQRRIAMPVEDLRRQEDRKLDNIEKEMTKMMTNDRVVFQRDPESGRYILDADGERVPMLTKLGMPVMEIKPGLRVGAAEVLVKTMDRRAKLRGLDAPSKVAQTDAEGNDIAAGALKNMNQSTVHELAVNIVQQMAHKVEMDKRLKEIAMKPKDKDDIVNDVIDIIPEVHE